MSQGALTGLAALANDNAWLVHRGRHLDVSFLLGVGDERYLVRIHRGRIEAMEKGPFVMPRCSFSLIASDKAWATFWQAVPPPGFHDLIAMIKTCVMTLEGDMYPFFANLRYFKELLALPRASAKGARS